MTTTRRDRIHAILRDAASRSAPVMNELAILAKVHDAGDLECNVGHVRATLRGLGSRVRCVVNGAQGLAKWQLAGAGT